MNNPAAVLITLALFLAICFAPLLFMGKNHPYKGLLVMGCIALAVLLVPAMLYNWNNFQNLMIVGWIGLGCWAYFGKAKAVVPIESQSVPPASNFSRRDLTILGAICIPFGIWMLWGYFNGASKEGRIEAARLKSENQYRVTVLDFGVENVRMEKDHPNTWVVKGMVRNNTNHAAKIAVDIKFLNAQGDITYSTKAPVNNFDPVQSGQAAAFDYAGDTADFRGVVKYDVIPYER